MQESPKQETPTEAGFIKIIVIIFITVVILSILNIDIRRLIESEAFQRNFTYLKEVTVTIWGWIAHIWTAYLKEPIVYLINFVQISVQKPV